MKKFVLILASLAVSAVVAVAQDMSAAVAMFNSGAESRSIGDNVTALEQFKQALTMGEACGEKGAELVENCRKAIPATILQIGKDLYNKQHDFDGAIAKIQEAVAVAKEYGVEGISDEADKLIPQITLTKTMGQANDAFKTQDFAAAIEGYKAVIAADSTNSAASLRLVQSYAAAGQLDQAKEALALATRNGQGDNAAKVLSTAFLRDAQAKIKVAKYAEAVVSANESAALNENANAYLMAASASSKMGKDADSIKYYEKYLQAAPDSKNAPAITFTIAALYQKSGNKAKALENYKKILSDPKFGAQAKQQVDQLSR